MPTKETLLTQFPGETVSELARQAATWLPRILLAMAILAVGWVVARMLRSLTGKMFGVWARRLAPRLSRFFGGAEISAEVERGSTSRSAARAAQSLVFWLVFLAFAAVATEALGLNVVSTWLASMVGFLPRLAGALFVLLLGVLLGAGVRTAVTAATGTAGFAYPEVLGRLARAAVLLVSLIVALDQIGLQVSLLIVMAAVVAGSMLGGAALAFGLGAKDSVSNILASHYLADTFKVGHHIRIGEVEGRILEITATSVIVDAGGSRAVIPASRFSEQVAVLISR